MKVLIILRVAVAILFAALLVANVFLQRENRDLKSELQVLRASDGPPLDSSIPVVTGTDLTGRPVTIDYSHRNDSSLFLSFSAVCGYSIQNWPNWSRLIAESPNVHAVFADTTGSSSPDFFRQLGVAVPAGVIKTTEVFDRTFNLRVTPTTILLGPRGKVKRVFIGILDDRKVRQLEADLHSTNSGL